MDNTGSDTGDKTHKSNMAVLFDETIKISFFYKRSDLVCWEISLENYTINRVTAVMDTVFAPNLLRAHSLPSRILKSCSDGSVPTAIWVRIQESAQDEWRDWHIHKKRREHFAPEWSRMIDGLTLDILLGRSYI